VAGYHSAAANAGTGTPGLWAVFHLAFGWQLTLLLLPICLTVPFVYSRRGRVQIGIIIHALVNGPAFVLVSLGVL
jgi:membrane protease YdiL (CAAX protease family)